MCSNAYCYWFLTGVAAALSCADETAAAVLSFCYLYQKIYYTTSWDSVYSLDKVNENLLSQFPFPEYNDPSVGQ
jgi:hypothetical protein